MLYFDNAATTQMSEMALTALLEVSKNIYGNPSSLYAYGKEAKKILTESRQIVAKCIGAKAEEIYFTSCGTESDNWAVSLAGINNCSRIVASQIEHHAVLNPIERLRMDGFDVEYVGVDNKCVVKKDEIAKLLDGKKKLFSIMLQNNETGVLQPIAEIAEAIHKDNAKSIIHTDAVQAIGHVHIDVSELGVDMLSASAHKFNGPKGVGFLYVKCGCNVSPFILGGGQERMLRSGTENVAGIYSMAKALEENCSQLHSNSTRIHGLEERFLEKLSQNGIRYIINGDCGRKAPGILNMSFEGVEGEALLYALDSKGICVSTGSACNSKSKDRSYVLSSMGLSDERIDSAVRISIGRYNTVNEIDELANSIVKYCNLVSKAHM